ncbi:TIGR02556 family CRISPR-associated protein [Thermodesulfatator indicus]
MLPALVEIGKALKERYPFPLVEVPYPSRGKQKPCILVIELASGGEALNLEYIYLADYSEEDTFSKYFFREPSAAQGPAASLSFKLPGTFKALKQRLDILPILGYQADTQNLAEKIEAKVKSLQNEGQLKKNTSLLIVLKIDGKWPAENKKLKENFIKNFLKKLGTFDKKLHWQKEGICHFCNQEATVYAGLGNLLKFYTVDKFGYAPELSPALAWKQYALCKDCILNLERGKRAAQEFLTFSFYGREFWLLPVSAHDLTALLKRFENFYRSTSGKIREEYEILEDRLLYEASKAEQGAFYHFVFLKKEQQALRILLHLEEVLPSVLGQYVALKQKLENSFNEEVEPLGLSGKIFFNFFSSERLKATQQKPGFTDKDFFTLVDRVFRRAKIDEAYLLSRAMARIQKDMAEGGYSPRLPKDTVLEIFLSLNFLIAWGILKRKGEPKKMRGDLPFYEFFSKYDDFFDNPAKRALVLLGVLVQKFLDYQYRERNSTPFIKNLKNLRLDQKDIQKLFTALQNKMNEYGIGHWWPELREGISLNLIEAERDWKLSPEEIGFYLAVGMSLSRHPAFGKKEEKNLGGENGGND